MKRKLISLFIANPMENQIIITLLKDGISYILRIEYLCNNDKIKETNHEIDKDLVYWIFCNLRVMIDQNDYTDNNDELANMKIYYGDNKYLEYKLTKKILKCFTGLNDVIKYMYGYIDDSLNKGVFI